MSPSKQINYSYKTIGIERMKAHYRFTQEDADILHALYPVAVISLEEMKKAFYEFIFNFEHAHRFLDNDEVLKKHEKGLSGWYLDLFSGKYDKTYFDKLALISETHVRVGLPSHYVNAAFSFVRQFLEKLLIRTDNTHALLSMHKIVDINLDILSLTYKQESRTKLLNEVSLLKRALKHDTIVPYVQPIYENKTDRVAYYECLMRIVDPETEAVESIYPMLSLSKQILIYPDLMHRMIEKSFEAFASNDFSFSVNLSYEDIADETFNRFLQLKLDALPKPQRVTFEILETDMIIDFDVVSRFIASIRAYGCEIAIDDFGTGYSNLETILKIKPDFIKIDGSLIRNIDHSEESLKLVKNIVNIAKDIGAATVAEFVHNKRVYDILQVLDVDYLQGFYLSEPFPVDNLAKP